MSKLTRDGLEQAKRAALVESNTSRRPDPPIYLPGALYDNAVKAGINMRGYAKMPLLPVGCGPIYKPIFGDKK